MVYVTQNQAEALAEKALIESIKSSQMDNQVIEVNAELATSHAEYFITFIEELTRKR